MEPQPNQKPIGAERAEPRSSVATTPALPRIVVGTSRLGSVLPDALSSRSGRRRALIHLDELLAIGCSTFDCAASYMIGGTERLLGAWIATRRNRDRLYLITKGAHPYPIVRPNRLTPGALRADLHASLRRLQTDHVDLYLLHRDAAGAPLEPIAAALASFRREGKIGDWGVSNWTHQRLASLDSLARSAGLPPAAASSPHFSLVDWVRTPWTGSVSIAGEGQREARAFYERTQMPVLAWSPLGSGFLALPDERMSAGSRRIYGSEQNFARKRRTEELARRYRTTPAQIALAYLFGQPFPVAAVVAASTAEKMRANLDAANLRLSRAEIDWLERGGELSKETH